ncbi:MAG TPA: hydrogenase [Proteobacteria bacterium]|nr:hydrogenase [Deltaproteobacteria bacterium]HDS17214.1 hydrogenase [Pseudomonadota bacterium]
MDQLMNAIFMLILALNLFALGNASIISVIRIVALQGVLMGFLPLFIHSHLSFATILASLAAISLKGIVIPAIMIKALRDVQIKREVEPIIGLLPSTIIGALVTAAVFLICGRGQVPGQSESLIIPTAITVVLVGFILLTTRLKSLTQVLGYLVLENGIYMFSLLLMEAIPLVVEMGMLLDLFVSIFIVSIITNQINRTFSSLDTRHLSSLKE